MTTTKLLLSKEDADLLQCPWYQRRDGYFTKNVSDPITGKRSHVLIHKLVGIRMGFPAKTSPSTFVIDHINRNPADNRRENLRLVSQSDNLLNASHTLKARRVFFDKTNGSWYGQFCFRNKKYHTPRVKTEELAAAAVRELRTQITGIPCYS